MPQFKVLIYNWLGQISHHGRGDISLIGEAVFIYRRSFLSFNFIICRQQIPGKR